MATKVNQNDLLEALQEAMAQPVADDGAWTAPEIAQHLGVYDETARKYIKRLLAKGVVKTVQVQRTRMDGRPTTVSAYRLA